MSDFLTDSAALSIGVETKDLSTNTTSTSQIMSNLKSFGGPVDMLVLVKRFAPTFKSILVTPTQIIKFFTAYKDTKL